MATSATYDAKAYQELKLRTQYEIYLLEASYSIEGAPVIPRRPDQMIYPPGGGEPNRTVYGSGNLIVGDWRAGFLNAGAPLVFSTTFKLLDMFLEWVILCNGKKPGRSFVDKIEALKPGNCLVYPPAIAQHSCLHERIIALFEKLRPLRNTITHSHTFTSSNGEVTVTPTNKNGKPIKHTVPKIQLRDLSILTIYLIHYAAEDWDLDDFRLKQLRWTMDKLQDQHGMTLLGQLQPMKLSVRLYRLTSNTYEIDLDEVRTNAAKRDPDRDIEFDIRLVTVDIDGSNIKAYMIPWEETSRHNGVLTKSNSELVRGSCDVPEDIDAISLAQELKVVSI